MWPKSQINMFKIRCMLILEWLAMKQCQSYAILGAVVLSLKKFVKENQFTGRNGFILLADNTLKIAPFAKLHVKTPFYRGEIEALCLDDCIYDLIIGNLPGVWYARQQTSR